MLRLNALPRIRCRRASTATSLDLNSGTDKFNYTVNADRRFTDCTVVAPYLRTSMNQDPHFQYTGFNKARLTKAIGKTDLADSFHYHLTHSLYTTAQQQSTAIYGKGGIRSSSVVPVPVSILHFGKEGQLSKEHLVSVLFRYQDQPNRQGGQTRHVHLQPFARLTVYQRMAALAVLQNPKMFDPTELCDDIYADRLYISMRAPQRSSLTRLLDYEMLHRLFDLGSIRDRISVFNTGHMPNHFHLIGQIKNQIPVSMSKHDHRNQELNHDIQISFLDIVGDNAATLNPTLPTVFNGAFSPPKHDYQLLIDLSPKHKQITFQLRPLWHIKQVRTFQIGIPTNIWNTLSRISIISAYLPSILNFLEKHITQDEEHKDSFNNTYIRNFDDYVFVPKVYINPGLGKKSFDVNNIFAGELRNALAVRSISHGGTGAISDPNKMGADTMLLSYLKTELQNRLYRSFSHRLPKTPQQTRKHVPAHQISAKMICNEFIFEPFAHDKELYDASKNKDTQLAYSKFMTPRLAFAEVISDLIEEELGPARQMMASIFNKLLPKENGVVFLYPALTMQETAWTCIVATNDIDNPVTPYGGRGSRVKYSRYDKEVSTMLGPHHPNTPVWPEFPHFCTIAECLTALLQNKAIAPGTQVHLRLQPDVFKATMEKLKIPIQYLPRLLTELFSISEERKKNPLETTFPKSLLEKARSKIKECNIKLIFETTALADTFEIGASPIDNQLHEIPLDNFFAPRNEVVLMHDVNTTGRVGIRFGNLDVITARHYEFAYGHHLPLEFCSERNHCLLQLTFFLYSQSDESFVPHTKYTGVMPDVDIRLDYADDQGVVDIPGKLRRMGWDGDADAPLKIFLPVVDSDNKMSADRKCAVAKYLPADEEAAFNFLMDMITRAVPNNKVEVEYYEFVHSYFRREGLINEWFCSEYLSSSQRLTSALYGPKQILIAQRTSCFREEPDNNKAWWDVFGAYVNHQGPKLIVTYHNVSPTRIPKPDVSLLTRDKHDPGTELEVPLYCTLKLEFDTCGHYQYYECSNELQVSSLVSDYRVKHNRRVFYRSVNTETVRGDDQDVFETKDNKRLYNECVYVGSTGSHSRPLEKEFTMLPTSCFTKKELEGLRTMDFLMINRADNLFSRGYRGNTSRSTGREAVVDRGRYREQVHQSQHTYTNVITLQDYSFDYNYIETRKGSSSEPLSTGAWGFSQAMADSLAKDADVEVDERQAKYSAIDEYARDLDWK